jgi:hypothetical protein
MTWVRIGDPLVDPALAESLQRGVEGYPAEYRPESQARLSFPDAVRRDSIVMAHSLIPKALEHFMAGYGALLSPSLPLSRRQQELIAAGVSALNRCFY